MERVYVLEEKLENAFNENAKLRVRLKEDENLWRGLVSKVSWTKTLCDQLTQTQQHLASQLQDAEIDKALLESKVNSSSQVMDTLEQIMQDLSSRLAAAEENIKTRDKELGDLKLEKEHKEMLLLEKLDSSELKLLNLDKKAAELQKDKDSLVYRLAGERSFANEAIEKLESEAKSLVSKNAEAKLMISQLTYFAKNQQEAIENLSEKVRISEDIKEELSLKLSSLEMEVEDLHESAQRKHEQVETLQAESRSHQLQAGLLASEVILLQSVIEDKEHLGNASMWNCMKS